MQDIWDFKEPQYPRYPTEKNRDLLESIVRASSEEGSVVPDFFCGSGTTLEVARNPGRRWIGIDSSKIAVSVAGTRLGANALFHFMESQVSDFVPELVLCEVPPQKKRKNSKPPRKKSMPSRLT